MGVSTGSTTSNTTSAVSPAARGATGKGVVVRTGAPGGMLEREMGAEGRTPVLATSTSNT
jgi:hypothetical protein